MAVGPGVPGLTAVFCLPGIWPALPLAGRRSSTVARMLQPIVNKGWLDLHPEARIIDVRWYLDGRDGRSAHEQGHIPGAVYLDLNRWLSSEPTPEAGRHPLPSVEVFAEGMRLAGISDDTKVVAYDDAGGTVAARLVWLLRLHGHDAALLDGGLQNWPGELAAGAVPVPELGNFAPRPWPEGAFVSMDIAAETGLLVDARAAERYSGQTEPVDARAGHIPGAINLPTKDNLRQDLSFQDANTIKARFSGHDIHSAKDVVVYCGSGVTACHTLLAMEHAGLGRGKLFPGSWSQWAATDRPAETA